MSADTVQRLTKSKISAVTTRSANAAMRIDDNDDGDVTMSSDRDCGIDSPLDQCVDLVLTQIHFPTIKMTAAGRMTT